MKSPARARLRAFPVDYFRPVSGSDESEWWRVALVQYDAEAVIESAFDLIRSFEDDVRGSAGEEFVRRTAEEERRSVEEIRQELDQRTADAMIRARRELRQLVDDAFEQLASEAFVMTGGFLAALVMDRMPDVFAPPLRRDAREDALSRARDVVHEWLNIGRPRTQPLPLDTARELLRLVEVGQTVFAGVRRPVESETFALAEEALRSRLSNTRERAAAQSVIKAVRRREIKGTDVQPKKLALRFAANVLGIGGSTRTLQRAYEEASKVVAAG